MDIQLRDGFSDYSPYTSLTVKNSRVPLRVARVWHDRQSVDVLTGLVEDSLRGRECGSIAARQARERSQWGSPSGSEEPSMVSAGNAPRCLQSGSVGCS